ncbi:hypothetical protein BJ878DRAFT_417499 [Calycina marina]|uniref:Hikeshi-like domain-containing protein n=1 Tax=Calycina marina TaxID=1763456 RepID=A0A9P7Z757_9HELO|nr:hypothetical protein BJ878DRAFT_417499 [Calycina marina]
MTLPEPFGIIPTGTPLLTTPTSAPSATQFLYTLPIHPFSHLCIFLQPSVTLPPNTAAAVYLQSPSPPPNGGPPFTFTFLGAIGAGKESAVFKLSPSFSSSTTTTGALTLGISIESVESVTAQLATLEAAKTTNNGERALVVRGQAAGGLSTEVLAQRIIKDAFNFLASFSGNLANGVEVVPLKAFQNWWMKFEGRIKSDPGFLERQEGD